MKKSTFLAISIFIFQSALFAQTFTFTPCGATGTAGPTQSQVDITYSNTILSGQVTSNNGIQYWIVPTSGYYNIETDGAQGGSNFNVNGAPGANMTGDFYLTAGQTLKIIAGQIGVYGTQGGGGGGSFVVDMNDNPLCIAGGGGGSTFSYSYYYDPVISQGTMGINGQSGVVGTTSTIAGSGGTSGNGGGVATTYTIAQASGGGGFYTNGGDGNPSTGGSAFINGALGGIGTPIDSYQDSGGGGGFGGGGGADWSQNTGGGGGGGYSGGGGGSALGNGGGGGSYNTGTNQNNVSGANLGNGKVLITRYPALIIAQTASISCFGDITAELTATGYGGSAPYNYTWTPSGINSATLSNIAAGVYTCVASDASSNTITATYTVTEPAYLTISANFSSPIVCDGQTVTLYGGGANSYTWSSGINDNVPFVPSATMEYTVNGTTACGTRSAVTTITVNSLPIVAANSNTTVICVGNFITLTGSGAQSYSWDNNITDGAPFASNITTTYNVVGTDVNGCTNTAAISVTVNSLPIVATNGNAFICDGNPVTLYGSGATSYTWSSGISDNVSFTPSATADYTVTGTDANGCRNTAITSITVVTTPTILISASATSVCAGNTIALSASGANSYTWTGTISNGVAFAPASTDTYIVSGANSCSTTTSAITIIVYNLPAISASATTLSVCAGSSLSLSGNGGISYAWSDGVSDNVSFSSGASHEYTVTGTDNNGCQNTATYSLTVYTLPAVTASASSTAICQNNSLILSGSGAISYSWNNGISNNTTFTPTLTDTYTVTGTDANGCENTGVITVTVNALPTVSVISSNTAICMGSTITLSGIGTDTYNWNNSVLNNTAFSPTTTNTYSVSGTNILTGCSNTALQTIVVNLLPTVDLIATETIVCMGHPVTLSGTGADNYIWTGGIIDGVPFTPTATTAYSVKGINVSTGCSSTNLAVQTIVVNALPTLTLSSSNTILCAGNPTTLFVSGALTYSWSTGDLASTTVVSPVALTSYTVTGTDVNGCENTSEISQEVGDCTGLAILNRDPVTVKVYPNPNDGRFVIQASEPMQLIVVDELGQMVKDVSLNYQNNYRIEISDLKMGIYLILNQDYQIKIYTKIIVTH